MENQVKTGAELIADERAEQVNKHGYTAQHDDAHDGHELLQASLQCVGMVYSTFFHPAVGNGYYWPWGYDTFDRLKDKSDTELLTIAGAFIAAEIDRRKRLEE